jgi:GNAT superfamily N-acetyltransferase
MDGSHRGSAGGIANVSSAAHRPGGDCTGRYGVEVIAIADEVPAREELLGLYGSVGWSAYTRDPGRLERALAGSALVATAQDADGSLAGLVRTVGDGVSICYVQDLLVRPDRQRRGIGRDLLEHVRARQAEGVLLVLTTDAGGTEDGDRSHPFYRSLGFAPHAEQGLAAFSLRV